MNYVEYQSKYSQKYLTNFNIKYFVVSKINNIFVSVNQKVKNVKFISYNYILL